MELASFGHSRSSECTTKSSPTEKVRLSIITSPNHRYPQVTSAIGLDDVDAGENRTKYSNHVNLPPFHQIESTVNSDIVAGCIISDLCTYTNANIHLS